MAFYNKRNRHPKINPKGRRSFLELATEAPLNPDRQKWLKKTPFEVDLVFFDLETTGGNPLNSSIIEIGAIKYRNGQEIERFETLVDPGRSIPRIVQKMTKINNEMVKKAPPIEKIFDSLIAFIGDAIIVAHGAQGDVSFLVHLTREIKKSEFTNFYFCTHLIVTNFMPNIPLKSVSGIAQYFNIPLLEAHSALNDSLMTAQIFWKLLAVCEKKGFRSCEDLLKIQGDQETLRKLGPGLNPRFAENAPTTTGLVYLLNSHHEISFVTASQNIKKTMQGLTEIGADKELNKLITDASGLKFERKSHFLEALLEEKKELKRLALPLDPRRSQNRVENFLQIFLPEDMIEHAKERPQLSFFVPNIQEDDSEDALTHDEDTTDASGENENLYVTLAEQHQSDIRINKTRKPHRSLKAEKFRILRSRDDSEISCVRMGHLKEGIGYCFGPFVEYKSAFSQFQQVINQFPFEDSSLPMKKRFANLQFILSLLSNNNDSKESPATPINKHYLGLKPKSGLCVISNNDFKEFEIAVVVRGRVVKTVRLPFEEGDRLRSSRYFTRLFEAYHADLFSSFQPFVFTEDVCSEIELFSCWLKNRKGEGEWVEFSELEGLYNANNAP